MDRRTIDLKHLRIRKSKKSILAHLEVRAKSYKLICNISHYHADKLKRYRDIYGGSNGRMIEAMIDLMPLPERRDVVPDYDDLDL